MTVLTEVDMTPAVRIGRWWFQRRSLSPLPLFLLMILLPPEFHAEGVAVIVPLLLIVLSEVVRVWAVGYAGSATRTRGDSVPQLVHAGPFRFVRNPLYIANITLYTSCAVVFGFAYLSALIFIFSCVQYHFIVKFEEETLSHLFGESYEAYRRHVPRWIPAFTPRIASSGHVFSLARSLKSEKSTFISMTFMAAAYTAKRIIIGT